MLTNEILKVTNFGAEFILWLLIILFTLEIAIMIERAMFYRKYQLDLNAFNKSYKNLLFSNKIDELKKELEGNVTFESHALLEGLNVIDRGYASVEEAIEGAKGENRIALERNLTILGTLGSNTPFIGLFGTVVGIIKAFKDLASASKGGDMLKNGQGAVMAGISEALVATGVGLLVAIPAVIAFNYFMRKVKVINYNTDVLSSVLMSYLKSDKAEEGGRSSATSVTDVALQHPLKENSKKGKK
jgi:biopolymer transport protein ExbB